MLSSRVVLLLLCYCLAGCSWWLCPAKAEEAPTPASRPLYRDFGGVNEIGVNVTENLVKHLTLIQRFTSPSNVDQLHAPASYLYLGTLAELRGTCGAV